MKVTLKLYATLGEYLPKDARNHAVHFEVAPGTTPLQLIERCNVPRKLAHLVVLNGVHLPPAERESKTLSEGDTLAVWPPVAGG
jgi:molybdopterin converting factor small subunit